MLAYDTYPELYKQSAIYAIRFGNIYICIQIFLVKINQNIVIAYQSITCLLECYLKGNNSLQKLLLGFQSWHSQQYFLSAKFKADVVFVFDETMQMHQIPYICIYLQQKFMK